VINSAKLKEIIPIGELDQIITSPLQRCDKLARELARNQPVETDKRIKEMNFGDWEMRNWNKIDREEIEQWMDNFVEGRTPNGESHLDLYNRAKEFWNDLIQRDYNKALVVTHAGVLRSLLAYILEMPVNKGFSLKLHYNVLIRVELIKDHHYNVEFLTCREWER
jgi:alpha-ribazole phosphatase